MKGVKAISGGNFNVRYDGDDWPARMSADGEEGRGLAGWLPLRRTAPVDRRRRTRNAATRPHRFHQTQMLPRGALRLIGANCDIGNHIELRTNFCAVLEITYNRMKDKEKLVEAATITSSFKSMAYCLSLGGSKPSPSGDGFSMRRAGVEGKLGV